MNDNQYINIAGISLKKKAVITAFIVIYILLFLVQHFVFIQRDVFPKFTDVQFFRSVDYYNYFIAGKKDSLYSIDFRQIQYPPLVYITTLPFYRLLGVGMNTARISMSLFIIIFLLAMFGIGKELGDDASGFAVMALAGASPHVLNTSRYYYLDFPQAALTALAFYLLLKSGGFRERKASILCGIVLALSFLAKWATGFFMAAPVLWFLALVIAGAKKYIPYLLTVLSLLTFAFLGSLWYFLNLEKLNLDPQWFLLYLLFIAAPAVGALFSIKHFENKYRAADGSVPSEAAGIGNFALFAAVFTLTASPWYFWAARRIRMKIYNDIAVFARSYSDNFHFLLDFFKYAFNLFPLFLLFMIIGLVFIFIRKNDRFTLRISIPISIICSFLVMWRLGYPITRYAVSLAIFAAALAGYWIFCLGKARLYASALIVLLSLGTVLGWMVLPKDMATRYCIPEHFIESGQKNPFGVFFPELPDERKFDLEPVIRDMVDKGGSRENLEVFIFYEPARRREERLPNFSEFMQWRLFFQMKTRWHFSEYWVLSLNELTDGQLKSLNNSSFILICYEDAAEGNKMKSLIEKQFTGETVQLGDYQVFQGRRVILIYRELPDRYNMITW